jgi:hypothetical protein
MGFPDFMADPAFQRGWVSLRDAGIPIAAAAGNDNRTFLQAPAKWTSTYSVAALGPGYMRWEHSAHNAKLNCFAPGHMLPTANTITGRPTIRSGSSMASPMVAGIMAIMMGYEGYWNIKNGQEIYDRLDENRVSLAIIDKWMLGTHTPPRVCNTGFNNPNKDWRQHPYAGIPWDNPSDLGPEQPIGKRQENPYANEDGDYRQKNYYDGPARTVEFSTYTPAQ